MTLSYGNPTMNQPVVNGTASVVPQGAQQMMAQTVPMPQVPQMPTDSGYYYNMPYSPVYGPRMPQQPQPIQNGGPSLSAVKIDINNPTMDANGGAQRAFMPQQPQYQQPQYMPQLPPPPIPQFVPTMPMPMPMPMPVPPPPVITQYPVPPAVIDTQATQYPQQVMPQQQQTVQQPVPPQPTQNAQQLDPAVVPLAQALAVITPENGKQPPTIDEEAGAVNVIAQFAKTYQAANEMVKAQPNNPQAINAREKVKTLIDPMLIDEKAFKALANIATKDTSTLSGQERQKADQNKSHSMWTLAMMQKIFRGEMDKELAKENMPRVSLGEVPGVSQIVDNTRKDPNPQVREDAIYALMEITDPKNPKDAAMMKAILNTVAKEDRSGKVKNAAKDAIKDLKRNG